MTTRWPCAAIVSLCGLLALAAPAWAEQGHLASTAGDWIPLWSSPVVVREGTDLETAGQFDLAVQRMACLVDNGTRVIGTFAGGSPGVPGGVSRIVVIEGEATGCTGYVSSILYFRPAPESNRKPASPCWTTKPEIASVKAALDAGNPTEARELSQKIGARIKECRLSPCSMTQEERDSIRAAVAARDNKLVKELNDKATDRSNKCWGR